MADRTMHPLALADLVQEYVGTKMTREMLAHLRHGVRQFGIEHVFMLKALNAVSVGPMDEATFTRFVGRAATQDDLERVNCRETGIGHFLCGWCDEHEVPRFTCGCASGKAAQEAFDG